MGGLADKLIQANERAERNSGDGSAPEGYYTDDLGYWVENNIRNDKHKFAKYVAFRCRKINPHLYYDPIELKLYNRHEVVTPTPNDILMLANMPSMITTAQAIWVYNCLKEAVPRLDRSRILVAPGLAWNMETSEFEKVEDNCYSVGGENDT